MDMDKTNKIGQAVDCFGVTWEVYRQRPASYWRRKYLGEIHTRELGTPPAPPFPWTPELDALLGTDSDAAIARKIGISHQGVRYRRKKLGIHSFNHAESVAHKVCCAHPAIPPATAVAGFLAEIL